MPIPAQTLTDVVNLALGLLGQAPINDFDDPGTTLAAFLRPTTVGGIRHVQAMYDWPELITVADLTAETEPTIDGLYSYPMPTDCLRLIEIENEKRYKRRGNKLLADTGDGIRIYYIAYNADPSEWSELLLEAIYFELTWRLAMPLTQQAELMQTWHDVAMRTVARNISLAEQYADSPQMRPLDSGLYAAIRYGGGGTKTEPR